VVGLRLDDGSPCVSTPRRSAIVSSDVEGFGDLGFGNDFNGLSRGSGACVNPPCDLIKLV